MAADEIYYFGYGSLVNRDTRPPEECAAPARLRGWHRVWGHRSVPRGNRPPACSLSVEPNVPEGIVVAPSTADAAPDVRGIDGVLVRLSLAALPVLDRRESGYDRLTLPADRFDLPDGLDVDVVHVYRSKVENRSMPTPARPILQSYVDCVMAGYLRVFGEGGLDDFVLSTRGWEGAILDDRAAPRYSRAVEVPGALLGRFDRLVGRRRGALEREASASRSTPD